MTAAWMAAARAAVDRAACAALDAADPLAACRDRFELPEGVIYLDGNSLGPLPRGAAARLERVVRDEWGRGLIRSWNAAGWIDLPARVGARIAPLVGAGAGDVVVADSTSLNVFKLLAAALRLQPERRVIVTEPGNFPTDLYMAAGLVELLGGRHELRLVDAGDVEGALDDDAAVVMLTHVDYRTGRMHDLDGITAAAHAAGALALWDLAHSAGAVPVDLSGAGADLAVGCGYKYLNGGPGAPAFAYVAPALQERVVSPLAGWMGHAAPFAFDPGYRPAAGVARLLCGTPAVLSLAALDAALDAWDGVDLADVRAKSLALTELFMARVDAVCAPLGAEVAHRQPPERRGSQAVVRHAEGYAVMQALIARGVIGDFRTPDLMRFGFAPLYTRFVDVWDAVDILADVLESGAWDRPEHRARAAVT